MRADVQMCSGRVYVYRKIHCRVNGFKETQGQRGGFDIAIATWKEMMNVAALCAKLSQFPSLLRIFKIH